MNKNNSKETATARDAPKELLPRLWKFIISKAQKYTQSLVPPQTDENEHQRELPIVLANKNADKQRNQELHTLRNKKNQKRKDQQLIR